MTLREASADFRGRWARRTWLAVILGYSAAHFVGTHSPINPQLVLPAASDKSLHFGSYFGLGLLVSLWPMTGGQLVLRLLVIAGWAAFDELTQPLVGRHADPLDWLADMAGASTGLLAGWVAARGLRLWSRRSAS